MSPATSPTDAVKVFADRVRARYNPPGNVHEEEWGAKYLGGSSIVKLTAAAYALRLLAQKEGKAPEDDGERYWSYKGNTLAAEAFADVDCAEVAAAIALDQHGWQLRIHPDGVSIIDGHAVVGEHKAHLNVTPAKLELAFRQGALGLAVMDARARQRFTAQPDVETVLFKVAPWHPDQNAFLEWPRGTVPAGVVVGGAPEVPPAVVAERPLTPADLDGLLAFYRAKAAVIIEAATTDDLEPALKWDLDHADEFAGDFKDMGKEHDLDLLLIQYDASAKAEKAAEATRKDLGRQIGEVLRQEGLNGAVAGKYRVVWVDGAAREYGDLEALRRDKKTEYILRSANGSGYPKVTLARA